MSIYVYFRNDDVNSLDFELMELTRVFLEEGVPITHAVEPANVKDDTVGWLLSVRSHHPHLIGIMQHGYDHRKRDLGEFGGRRTYADQYRDLRNGKMIMQQAFGENLLNAINFPFGPFNPDTVRAIDDLGFEVMSSHFNYRLSRRLFYALSRVLDRGQLLGKYASRHMSYYPGTRLYVIDMCISFIRSYQGPYGSRSCEFMGLEALLREFSRFRRYTDVVGFLLHHRYHGSRESLQLVRQVIRAIRQDPAVEFASLDGLHRRFAGI